jgi:addiction module HigA family antidote
MKRKDPLGPVHPGEVLREEFLAPLNARAYAVAKACHVPRTRIERITREETPVTADTALRLGRALGTSPQFWMNLQSQFDLDVASRASKRDLQRIDPIQA